MAWFDGLTPEGKDFAVMLAVVGGATEKLGTASSHVAMSAADAEVALAALRMLLTWNVRATESNEAIAAAEKAVNAIHLAISEIDRAVNKANKLLGM